MNKQQILSRVISKKIKGIKEVHVRFEYKFLNTIFFFTQLYTSYESSPGRYISYYSL